MDTPLLQIKDLEVWFKVFEGSLKVLNRVNLEVGAGERVGLVGEMGCGKTTTMKAVTRLLSEPPAVIRGGEVRFKGRDLLKASKREVQRVRRNNLSMIFEDPTAALNPVYTIGTQVRDAVRFSGILGSEASKAKIQEAAVRALEEVSLPDPGRVLKNYPVQLSGGMRQRICIALALLSTNDILIADEPDTALDVTIKDQILRLLDDLVEKKGTSIVLISHTLGAVRKMTDRLYVMYAGTILESAPTKELFLNPAHPYSRLLLESAPRLTGGGIGEGIEGRIPEYIDPPAGCRFHPRCPEAREECASKRPVMVEASPGHYVACHEYNGQQGE